MKTLFFRSQKECSPAFIFFEAPTPQYEETESVDGSPEQSETTDFEKEIDEINFHSGEMIQIAMQDLDSPEAVGRRAKVALEAVRNLVEESGEFSPEAIKYLNSDGFEKAFLKLCFEIGMSQLSQEKELPEHEVQEGIPAPQYDPPKESPPSSKKETPTTSIESSNEKIESPGFEKATRLFENKKFEAIKKIAGSTWEENSVKYTVRLGTSLDMATSKDKALFGTPQTRFLREELVTQNPKTKNYTAYVLLASIPRP